MADPRNCRRPVQLVFVDEKELDVAKTKIALLRADNMSAQLRKMAIDGHIVKSDLSELRDLSSKMNRSAGSESQRAKKFNAKA